MVQPSMTAKSKGELGERERQRETENEPKILACVLRVFEWRWCAELAIITCYVQL